MEERLICWLATAPELSWRRRCSKNNLFYMLDGMEHVLYNGTCRVQSTAMTARQQLAFESKVTALSTARKINRQHAAEILVSQGVTAESMPH